MMEKKRLVIRISLGMLLLAALAILLCRMIGGQKRDAEQEGMLVRHSYVQTAEEDAAEAICFWLGEEQI